MARVYRLYDNDLLVIKNTIRDKSIDKEKLRHLLLSLGQLIGYKILSIFFCYSK